MYIARYKTNDKMEDILLTSDGNYLTRLYFEEDGNNIKKDKLSKEKRYE